MARTAAEIEQDRLYIALAPFFKQDAQYGFGGRTFCRALMAMLMPAAEIVQPSDTKPGWAILANPQTCPVAWLPWLGQFVGIEPSSISTLIATGQTALAREWIEHPINFLRGTVQGMTLAAKATLTGTKTVFLYTRYNGEAFVIKAATLATETAHSAETQEAIESMMPAWDVLQYETVTGGTLAILEASHPKLSEVEAAHVTDADLEAHPEK
jgi:hypothetical protein